LRLLHRDLVGWASSMGFATAVQSFPEGIYGLNEVGMKPVAGITLTPAADPRPDELSAYLYARQTNRRPSHGGAPVSDEQFADIATCVRDSDVQVIGTNDRAPQDVSGWARQRGGTALAEDGDQHTTRLDEGRSGLCPSQLGRRKARAADASVQPGPAGVPRDDRSATPISTT
jgi:hypothetical protein